MHGIRVADRGSIVRTRSGNGGTSLHIAYIVSSYGAVTHTFIRNEVETLRMLGLAITVVSIHGGSRNPRRPAPRRDDASLCLFPLDRGAFIGAHAALLLLRPAHYFRCAVQIIGGAGRGPKTRLRGLFHFAEAVYAAQLLKGRSVSHVHAHFGGGPAEVARGVSLLLGTRYSFTAHRAGLFDENPRTLRGKVEKAAFVVAISEFNRQYISRLDPTFAKKTYVNYCGIDSRRFSPPSHCRAAREHSIVILSVGSLLRRKGYDYLLPAFQLLKRDGARFRSIIVGDGPEKARIKNMISAYGLDECVQLPGSVDNHDLHLYLSNADIFVLCSLSEGIPVAIMEAMAAGLPVVATDITGIPELVEHNKSGLLVRPRDSRAIYEAIKSLLTDRSKREELGRNARSHVLDHFDMIRNAENLKGLFESRVS